MEPLARVARVRVKHRLTETGGKMNEENKNTPEICQNCPNGNINTHFTLSVIAVVLSCFTGFWSIPLALTALILSLRAQDLVHDKRTDEARKTAWWSGLFGWMTVLIALIPVVLIILFGGAIVAFFAAALAAA